MLRTLATVAMAMLVMAGLSGCAEKAGEHAEEAKSHAAKAVSTAANAQLALADQVDGTEDKVVHNCAGCKLAMAGKADHALQVGDYAMHFCTEPCKEGFAEDVEKSLLALEFPQAEEKPAAH